MSVLHLDALDLAPIRWGWRAPHHAARRPTATPWALAAATAGHPCSSIRCTSSRRPCTVNFALDGPSEPPGMIPGSF